MQHLKSTEGLQNAWSIPRNNSRFLPSKTLHIRIYDSSISPETILRQLEIFSGRIHRAAVNVRSDGGGIPPNGSSVAILSLKVEFLTVDAAVKALGGIQSKQPRLGLAELAQEVSVHSLPSFSLDEDDTLLDISSLHEVSQRLQISTRQRADAGFEQRSRPGMLTTSISHPCSLAPLPSQLRDPSGLLLSLALTTIADTNESLRSSADIDSLRHSMEIPVMTRPRSCGSEGGSYASSSAPSAGSSTGSSSSAQSGSLIRRDDALITHRQNPLDLEYHNNNPIALHMVDILDDYEDLASEISKFDLNTPTNARGNAPWKETTTTSSASWEPTSASVFSGAIMQPYQRPMDAFGFSRRSGRELSPPVHIYGRQGIMRDDPTPRTSPHTHSFGVNSGGLIGNQHRLSSSPPEHYNRQTVTIAPIPSESPMYHHHRNFSAAAVPQRPHHTRDSSYSSTATSQSRHSDHQSHDSKSTSSHSSTSTHAKRSHKKSNQDKRVYVSDPHKGPRPTDWMLSEDTLKSREIRDARFAQIVAAGLAPGRTKAGWTQARRPGKRDRDAAKAKLREMEEEKERERLRQLLGEDARPRAPATGLAC